MPFGGKIEKSIWAVEQGGSTTGVFVGVATAIIGEGSTPSLIVAVTPELNWM